MTGIGPPLCAARASVTAAAKVLSIKGKTGRHGEEDMELRECYHLESYPNFWSPVQIMSP